MNIDTRLRKTDKMGALMSELRMGKDSASLEENMTNRFVRSRDEAEQLRKMNRAYKQHELKTNSKYLDSEMFDQDINFDDPNKSPEDLAREIFGKFDPNKLGKNNDMDNDPKMLEMQEEFKKIFNKNAPKLRESMFPDDVKLEKAENIESQILIKQGFDPLKDHKELAKSLNISQEYIDKVDETGMTIPEEIYEKRKKAEEEQKRMGKRSLEGSMSFSMVDPQVSEVKLEEYKASIHSPSLKNIPADVDREEYLKQFTDEEIKGFMENTELDTFDNELIKAVSSRMSQINRRDTYRKSGFKPSTERLDDIQDIQVRMTKQQEEFERATKLQQNILDMELTKEQDKEFKALVESENMDQSNVDPNPVKRIIGFEDKKTVTMTNKFDDPEENPVMNRVNKQLEYMTKYLNLDERQQKHWFYKIRREELELERQREVQAKINAKKETKRIMRKLKLPVLEKLYDLEHYYDTKDEEKEDIPRSFNRSTEEILFYNSDKEFMIAHKRTKQNMEDVVKRYLVYNQKQTILSGVKNSHMIYPTRFKLNKAMSLLHIWWTMDLDNIKKTMSEDITLTQEQVKEARDDVRAKIQANLTKFVPYLRSKVCQEIGLRKAPEIRFYHDNQIDIMEEMKEDGYESIMGYKYDDNNYDEYLRDFNMF